MMKNLNWIFLGLLVTTFTSTSLAGTVTRREIEKNGKVYIEETVIGENGNISKSTYPKRGSEKTDSNPKEISNSDSHLPGLSSQYVGTPQIGRPKPNPAMIRLNRAIEKCKPYVYRAPHPLVKGFKIEFKVHGLEKGLCKFTQTLPDQGLQTCLFTEKHRKDLAERKAIAFEEYLGNKEVCPIAGY